LNLGAALMPASLGAAQVLRLRRLALAALTYVLSMALVTVGWKFDLLPASATLEIGMGFAAINLGLYAAFRSGFNLRFADASLTLFQILAGISILMYIVYNMNDGRNLALIGCFVVFQFGIFRLKSREFTLVTLYTLAAYALVINLLMHLRPEAIHDVRKEWMSWLLLAGFLPVFSIVGGQVSALRRRMRDSARQLRLFADNIPAMTVSWDENLRCRFASKDYVAFFSPASDIVEGRLLQEILGERVYRENERSFTRALQGHLVAYERIHELPNAESRHLAIKLLPHFGDQGKVAGFFSVITDITEYKLTEARIQQVAHHDSLTGLPNRLLFNDRLDQAISLAKRDSRQFALLYLDLDKFKPVNDTLGHTAGDQLLKGVAARLRHLLRESDTLSRVGGDEFIVILPDIAGREVAETVVRKVVSALAAPFLLGDPKHSIEIGASIGISVYPADGNSADALVKAADNAMYTAKQSGGFLELSAQTN